MRFKWRSHLAVTALAAFSLLPFTGCSSQQQQASDEVSAQEGDGGDGQQQEGDAQANTQQVQGEAGSEGGNETAENPTTEEGVNPAATGEEVVSNPTAAGVNGAPATDGDLTEIINEMSGNGSQAQAAPTEAAVDETATSEAAPAVAPTNSAAASTAAPTASAPVAGLPEMGSKMPYVVEAGDTLGKVATRIYGDQKRWREISDLTGLSDPNHIFPGDVVYFSLDEASSQFAATYASLQRSKETVRQGDTLASIASRVYGSSRSWRHIWRQNDHIDNPDQLSAGMTIYYINKDAIKTAFNDLLKQKANKTAFKAINGFKTTKVNSAKSRIATRV